MNCEELRAVLGPYIDGELDLFRVLELEQHRERCIDCQEICIQEQELHQLLQHRDLRFDVPAELEERIRTCFSPSQAKPQGHRLFRLWRLPAFAIFAFALATFVTIWMIGFRHEPRIDPLAREVVSAHIRSLIANHLFDIASSDQHTVKPWFGGKIDFAPAVKDLKAEGFPLRGGRLDYLGGHPAAALVYLRHQHKINLFSWPSNSADSAPHTVTIMGYNVVHWTQSQMAYWAVSDVSAQDLQQFVRDQRESR